MNRKKTDQTQSASGQAVRDELIRPRVRRIVPAMLSTEVAPEGHREWDYREGGSPLLTDEIRQRLPKLYATENDEDPIVQARFRAWSGCHWNVVEFDGEDIFFGLIWEWYPTWSYFALSHLETINARHGASAIVADRGFEPEPVSSVMWAYRDPWS